MRGRLPVFFPTQTRTVLRMQGQITTSARGPLYSRSVQVKINMNCSAPAKKVAFIGHLILTMVQQFGVRKLVLVELSVVWNGGLQWMDTEYILLWLIPRLFRI